MTLRVGGEVDSQCTKCRMVLAHTIIAMVGSKPERVQCNTCNGQHKYRSVSKTAASKPATARAARSDSARPAVTRLSFDEALAAKGPGSRPYSIKTVFLKEEVLVHPTFGAGWVEEVRGDKVDVVFKSGTKTLVHAKS